MASVFTRYLAKSSKDIASGGRLFQQLSSKCTGRTVTTTAVSRQRINVGIIGMGRIGQLHLSNVLANRQLKLNWIVEENEKRAREVEDKFFLTDTPFYRPEKLNSLLEDDNLHGVLILTPIGTHTDLSCHALEKGKAVFVEKPAGQTVGDINRCFDTAGKYKRPFVVGFNRRFDSTFKEVHREVTNGSIGKLQYIYMTTRDSPKPSYEFLENCDSGGCSILTDLAVHDIDHLVWITEAERPEHIYVTTHGHDKVMADFGESDAIGIMIKYKSGIIATVNAFRESVYGYDIRSEVFGSEGMVSAGNPRCASTVVDRANGGAITRLLYSFPQRFDAAFKAELDHFCDCVQGKASPLVTKEESAMVAEIVDKGLESFHSKQPVYF